ncbi:complex I subunit 4 family protein [Prolixibacter denitrificans]|uniref:NADH dehydrogenase subunit M n=1 Tax=Prolixibacter denitrificans TaxID=1541063 RepID=A0A2P8C611_9BACT|nr:NADH-quinone oxidoreductase subunit M [Prolixibacter denitrificans]PSK80387.1 NADH-quinone oxidoreductase subunit M [Prolixibacter denitrificans]GET23094.1 NADH dehydrogenase subunit M [Prolixibacter denitrificans]
MNILSLLILIPLLTVVGILLVKSDQLIRKITLAGSALQVIFASWLTAQYVSLRHAGATAQMLFESSRVWFRPLGINYHIGVDGISLVMILLTAVVVLAGVLVSWKIEKQVKEFFFMLLLLSVGAYGFFISLNLFSMFFFLELAVIPKYLLIGIWGTGKKENNAMKLALMLMTGSALVFLGIVGLYFASGWFGGEHTWDIMKLSHMHLPMNVQVILYFLTFIGFGVFTGMFPFHTWAPDGHSSAPTAASMFLAGISMKLGGYGLLRVATYLMPDAAREYSWIFIILATIAIFYGALATLMQKDLKYMNAYSSVSHVGFVVLGVAMITKVAFAGAVLQMVSHGIMTALFFAAIGMIYDRAHTRMSNELGGVLKQMPFIGTVFIIAGLTSLGLPGFSGFVSEMTVFVGSWVHTGIFYRVATILAAASIVITAVYILRATGFAIWGTITRKEYALLKDASWNERWAAVILIVGIVLIGLAPFLFMHLINADVQEIFNHLHAG